MRRTEDGDNWWEHHKPLKEKERRYLPPFEAANEILAAYNALCLCLKLPPNSPGKVLLAKAQQIMDAIEAAKARTRYLEEELAKYTE